MYQSLVKVLQWSIFIGQFNIVTAVMMMSFFRAQPHIAHLEHIKCICGYLYKMKDAAICIRVGKPDYSDLVEEEYDWTSTVYGDVSEILPKDAPVPLGNFVMLSHYMDANLYHNMLTGRLVTGILHYLNKMPIDWYSKKQATIKTATYGSELVSACLVVDQIVDLQLTLQYLGVPICEKSYFFRDNKSVVNSSTKPHSKLHKQHNALSFHWVCEAVASHCISFMFIDGEYSPADILSKHWGYQQVWKILKPILFFGGNTADLYEDY